MTVSATASQSKPPFSEETEHHIHYQMHIPQRIIALLERHIGPLSGWPAPKAAEPRGVCFKSRDTVVGVEVHSDSDVQFDQASMDFHGQTLHTWYHPAYVLPKARTVEAAAECLEHQLERLRQPDEMQREKELITSALNPVLIADLTATVAQYYFSHAGYHKHLPRVFIEPLKLYLGPLSGWPMPLSTSERPKAMERKVLFRYAERAEKGETPIRVEMYAKRQGMRRATTYYFDCRHQTIFDHSTDKPKNQVGEAAIFHEVIWHLLMQG